MSRFFVFLFFFITFTKMNQIYIYLISICAHDFIKQISVALRFAQEDCNGTVLTVGISFVVSVYWLCYECFLSLLMNGNAWIYKDNIQKRMETVFLVIVQWKWNEIKNITPELCIKRQGNKIKYPEQKQLPQTKCF